MEISLGDVAAILGRTPGVLTTLLQGLPDAWVCAREQPGAFSPRDVVGHLIHGEETDWIPRVMIILEHGENQPFVPFDRFGFHAKYAEAPIDQLLDRFTVLRTRSLGRLAALNLQPSHLALRGRHPELGPVTLGQLLSAWVVHDLGHLFQIERVMANQYRDAVGPWRRYLRILES